MSQPDRILLGHLATFGDCLYATAVARQIKHDFPGCHLTWAIGSMSRPVIRENPFVDEVWEYPLRDRREIDSSWWSFVRDARRRVRRGEFSRIFFTQVAPGNYQNFDGTVRSSIFRGYAAPITVPVTPVLRLTADEVDHVQKAADLGGDAGLLHQLAQAGVLGGLAGLDPAAGDAPFARAWRLAAADQEHFLAADADHADAGDGRPAHPSGCGRVNTHSLSPERAESKA